jgi:hypothetical protein
MTTKSIWVFYKGYDTKKDDEIRKIVGRDDDGSGYAFYDDTRDLAFLDCVSESEVDSLVKKLEATGCRVDIMDDEEENNDTKTPGA